MINALISGIFNVVLSLVNVILSPIDLLIKQYLPDLSSAISAIGSMLNIVGNDIGFIISLTGLSSTALSLIVMYYTFKLTLPILVSAIKQGIKWYKALKL